MTNSENPSVTNIKVDETSEGQRLGNFLIRHLKGVPKSHIYRLIRTGQVRLNKKRTSADERLCDGDIVRVPPVRVAQINDEDSFTKIPPKEFEILFEDDFLIAINKPAGVAVHGGSGVNFGVIEQLRAARNYQLAGGARFLELIHRLDRETSGVLLIAKKRSALVALQEFFRNRQIQKKYHAIVWGIPEIPKNGILKIDTPLKKYLIQNDAGQEERRVKIANHNDENAMSALTFVKIKKQNNDKSLLEVIIKTGRTHQIRVHLSSKNHSIIGDEKYGDFEKNKNFYKIAGIRKMFLHAAELIFNHPQTGEKMILKADAGKDWEVI